MRQFFLSFAVLVLAQFALVPVSLAHAAPQEEAPEPTKDEVTADYLASVKKSVGKQEEGPAKATAQKLVEIW